MSPRQSIIPRDAERPATEFSLRSLRSLWLNFFATESTENTEVGTCRRQASRASGMWYNQSLHRTAASVGASRCALLVQTRIVCRRSPTGGCR